MKRYLSHDEQQFLQCEKSRFVSHFVFTPNLCALELTEHVDYVLGRLETCFEVYKRNVSYLIES